ncbi:Cell division protein, septum formation initiator [gamma proteobacterium HdN1]|nr:Cell division protein, septum formation initiator [gamma proteobacterium HdN1]
MFWSLLIAFVLLQYRLWVGEGSFAEVWRLQTEIEKQEQENYVLGERNRRLTAEVKDLQEGSAAVEERARKQLGMIKSDEMLFIVRDSNSQGKK